MHSYCVIPSNTPFIIQRDVLVYEQSNRQHDSVQTYITAVGRCFLCFVSNAQRFCSSSFYSDSTSNRVNDTCFWLHAQVHRSFCCISEYNRNKQSTWRVINGQSGESRHLFRLLWLGKFKTSICVVGRLTCAPETTRLTPQLVGISVKS